MKPTRTEAEIITALDKIALEISQVRLYLEGSLQKSVKRYKKKDGTVSAYELPPVLQYPKENGGQRQMRMPRRHVALVEVLLAEGKKRQKLLAHHRALSLELVQLHLRGVDAEKKTPLRKSRSPR